LAQDKLFNDFLPKVRLAADPKPSKAQAWQKMRETMHRDRPKSCMDHIGWILSFTFWGSLCFGVWSYLWNKIPQALGF